MAAINDIGNGIGYLYITAPDGTTILAATTNDTNGKIDLQDDALIVAPIAGEITGIGNIVFSGVNANVTALTVNAVPVITGTVLSGATIADTVAAVRDNINTTLSTPKYYALSQGDTLYILASGQGSAANGFAIAIATTMTTVVKNIDGGTSPQNDIDQSTGHRYFINANYSGTAVPNSLTNAVEITGYLVMRGLQGGMITENQSLSSHAIAPIRKSLLMNIIIDTEGEIASDHLNTILPFGFSFGDFVVLTAASAARIITVKNFVGSNDNIYLAGGDWVSGAADTSLILQYTADNGGSWQERLRTPAVNLSVTSLRAAGVPIPVSGVNKTTLTNGGGTLIFTPGIDKGYQIFDGSINLTAGQVIEINPAPATPYLDGDTMWFDYRAINDPSSINTVTIGNIILTTKQAQLGKTIVRAVYKLSNTTWYYVLFMRSEGLDLVNKVSADAAYQEIFPTPAGNGYVLIMNTDRSRATVPFPAVSSSPLILGDIDASTNPNYPAAIEGNAYRISVDGRIGGVSGKVVVKDSVIYARATNAGGTEAAVGTSWIAWQAALPIEKGLGQYSLQLSGQNTLAIGDLSSATGNQTLAAGQSSNAQGTNTVAGNFLRNFTVPANGTTLTFTGIDVTSEFVNGHTLAIILSNGSIVIRTINSVPAYGGGNTTFNISSAINNSTTSGSCVDTFFGTSAHSEGNSTQANGYAAHSEGNATIASGNDAHAEGNSTIASGTNSHSQGDGTVASGDNSHAQGTNNKAKTKSSDAKGENAVAYHYGASVFGMKNSGLNTVGSTQIIKALIQAVVVGDSAGTDMLLYTNAKLIIPTDTLWTVVVSTQAKAMGVSGGIYSQLNTTVTIVNDAGTVSMIGIFSPGGNINDGTLGSAAWITNFLADNVNKALKIQAVTSGTGGASTQWFGKVEIYQTGFRNFVNP